MDRMGAQDGEVLTHPMITRSIEGAQKRVELQNFQSRKRLLEYDDVMNQQREVVYSLRSFALEGGEELKGEARKMVERALQRRVETAMADFDPENPDTWDPALLRQDLLMHFLVQVPELEPKEDGAEPDRPTGAAEVQEQARAAGVAAFERKITELDEVQDDGGNGFGERLLALVMLNVLDEKWKDHLYDLDQLRAAIHYRSWGQKDPLVEYKGEAYTMFVELMHDVADTFTDRFLKAQLSFGAPDDLGGDAYGGAYGGYDAPGAFGQTGEPRVPTKRYNAFGILEDIPADELAAMEREAAANGSYGANGAANGADGDGAHAGGNGVPARRPLRFDALGRVIAEGGEGADAAASAGGGDDVLEATYDGEDAGATQGAVVDVGPSEPPDVRPVTKSDPAV
jgi:preprotein translocase subunit SecA